MSTAPAAAVLMVPIGCGDNSENTVLNSNGLIINCKKTVLLSAAFLLNFRLHTTIAQSQVAFPPASAEEPVYSMEGNDWSVSPTSAAKKKPYHAPITKGIPGARTISTAALQQFLRDNKDIMIIDVLDSKNRKSILGAV